MAKILCLETATTNCSVALSINGSVAAFKEDNSQSFSHAERLHTFISEVLSMANIEFSELDAVAISKGPGSYTGLRIGVSAAKGLCFSLDIPLISVSTLQSLANQVTEESNFVVPMLDARRMEVYAAVFNEQKEFVRNTKAEILDKESYSDYLDLGKVIFIGNGVDKFQELCAHPNAIYLSDLLPSAIQMVPLAEEKFREANFENVAYFEPYYLKDFVKS